MVHRERGPETDARGGSFRGGESELSSSGAVVSMHFGKEGGRGPRGQGWKRKKLGFLEEQRKAPVAGVGTTHQGSAESWWALMPRKGFWSLS